MSTFRTLRPLSRRSTHVRTIQPDATEIVFCTWSKGDWIVKGEAPPPERGVNSWSTILFPPHLTPSTDFPWELHGSRRYYAAAFHL